MIALDTSAIVAILLLEPEEEPFRRIVAVERAVVGTPTLFETRMVLTRDLGSAAADSLAGFLRRPSIQPVAFSLDMMRIASDAFGRYGKGRGQGAGLNFGDCMSYAVAAAHGVALLYKGGDFARTDVRPAYLAARP